MSRISKTQLFSGTNEQQIVRGMDMGKGLEYWWRGREEKIAIDVQSSRLIVASRPLHPSLQPYVRIIPLGSEECTIKHPGSVERVSDLLRRHLINTDFCYAQLGVSLPSYSTFIAHHPDTFRSPFSEIERVEEWMSESLSLNQDEHRVRLVPYPVGDMCERYVVAASKRSIVEFWERVAEELGGDLVLVAPRACALYRYGCHGRSAGGRSTSLWIDMTEDPPYAHLFDSGAVLGSFQMRDLPSLRDLAQRKLCGVEAQHREDFDKGDVSVWCVLREGESISDISRSPGFGSWHVGQLKETKDETIAALGILSMLEDLGRED